MSSKTQNLANSYSRVVRYGLAPEADVTHWATQGKGPGFTIADGSHPDHFFADLLQDHDDPRHAIVRKDLSYRTETGGNFHDNIYREVDNIAGSDASLNHELPVYYEGQPAKETLNVGINIGNKGKAYWVKWYPAKAHRVYDAVFNPEEMREFLDNIGAHEANKKTILDS